MEIQEQANKQLIEQYKSYFDKLTNGFPSKEYAGSKLIATNKSQFCENGACKAKDQDALDTSKISLDSKTKKDLNDVSTASNVSNGSLQTINHTIHQVMPHKESKDYITSQVNQLAKSQNYVNTWQNNMQTPFYQNGMRATPGFQRFSGLNRSLRVPVRNSNLKFVNNFF